MDNQNNDPDILVNECCKLFSERKKTVAFAESVTAGYLAHKFSLSPYAGRILKGGIVCYNAEVKKQLLRVPASAVKKFTPASPEVTKMIAEGLKELIKADYYIGITGLLRPGGSESVEKPVGTVFTSTLGPKGTELCDRELFKGTVFFQSGLIQCLSACCKESFCLSSVFLPPSFYWS